MTLDIGTEAGPIAVTEVMESHVNCRCTMVPRAKSYAELTGDPTLADNRVVQEDGPAAFAKLSPAVQRQILGPGKFGLYQQGVPLDAMWERVYSGQWGTSRVAKPLYRIQAEIASGKWAGLGPSPLSDAAGRWATVGQDYAIKQAASRLLAGSPVETQADRDALSLLRALDAAPSERRSLYRGLMLDRVPKQGSIFREPIGSWTTTRATAEGYAENPAGSAVHGVPLTGNRQVLLIMRYGKSLSMPELDEFLSGGEFEVIGTRWENGLNVVTLDQRRTLTP